MGYHGNHMVTAEQGLIKLWLIGADEAEGGGLTFLREIPCSREPIKALFLTPGGLHVVSVFEELGVVLFSTAGGRTERHALLRIAGHM